jgi:hypothetical protein
MRFHWTLFGAFLACVVAAQAQLSLGVVLSQDQFLPGESIQVSVRITNFSGQALTLGGDNQWLRFTLDAKEGPPPLQISDIPVRGEFTLESSTIATKRADLVPHFETLKPGRYILKASARIDAPIEFDILQGSSLWEQSFGVPQAAHADGRPEIRRYSLQQAIHLKQMKLYVRVTDLAGDRIFGVFPLGPMLTFSVPEQQIDRESRLHVLYQYGARSFYYSVVTPDGRLLIRHTHDYSDTSRPTLGLDESGRIMVRGGFRRPARDDFPQAAPEIQAGSAKPEPPPPPPAAAPPSSPQG